MRYVILFLVTGVAVISSVFAGNYLYELFESLRANSKRARAAKPKQKRPEEVHEKIAV
jgi:hypothetical protein